jgi:hypothetical protein
MRKEARFTVRQLYYQAEVRGAPGIDKTEGGYNKVQRQVLALRRTGRLPYTDIADLTRWSPALTTGSRPHCRTPHGFTARRYGLIATPISKSGAKKTPLPVSSTR